MRNVEGQPFAADGSVPGLQPGETKKSSRCDSGNCVVVQHRGEAVAYEDMAVPGTSLSVGPEDHSKFVRRIRDGEFDLPVSQVVKVQG